ncbi:MAG TPA: ATP-binding protein [Candidatus Limnocylindrales bacterium]|jgi:signal transduction histidine kinase/HAMP domain-containing protein|nr:ATP-binding protein [Candidatus Limnocylindrales bacterium]
MPDRGRAFKSAGATDDGLTFDDPDGFEAQRFGSSEPRATLRLGLSFRSRLLIGLVAAAITPLVAFGAVLFLLGHTVDDVTIGRVLLLVLVIAAMIAILLAYLLAADLTAPLRAIAAAVERTSAGDLSTPIVVPGEDDIARLAESHNRLAADIERRNRELGRILAAVESTSPRDSVEFIVGRAAADARAAFGMIDADVRLVGPTEVPEEERIPGEPLPVRAVLRNGTDQVGVLVGHLPATRQWDRADQDLLEVFASEIAVAIRNAELFARVEAQNAQLLELDAAKDDFLRGVSHNLQTPLTSIRATADQLRRARPDPRLGMIIEQTDRLSRMVRQLLTVTRLESGGLRPRIEVVAVTNRIRRAWEALATDDVAFSLDDRSGGWLAVADVDQLDQVLWALLDNALKYGEGAPIAVEVAPDADATPPMIRVTIADRGPGIAEQDRGSLFGRFERGAAATGEGSGLGLYVSRALCHAMGGDLVLEPSAPGRGAAFTVYLPGEPPEA